MFTCPVCGMTSSNPEDAREGYCGNCHSWTAPQGPQAVHMAAQEKDPEHDRISCYCCCWDCPDVPVPAQPITPFDKPEEAQ